MLADIIIAHYQSIYHDLNINLQIKNINIHCLEYSLAAIHIKYLQLACILLEGYEFKFYDSIFLVERCTKRSIF